MTLDAQAELDEFRQLQADKIKRSRDWDTARKAFEGEFDWPTKWDPWKKQLTINMVRRSVLTHANFLMGRGFTTQIEPLGTGSKQREAAQTAEKALFKTIDNDSGWSSLWRAAKVGSMLGTSGFKVYQDPRNKKACFRAFQPEYFHPITAGDDYLGLVKVHYAYSIDKLEAARLYGGQPEDYKAEDEMASYNQGDLLHTKTQFGDIALRRRRVPVLETWTDNEYLLYVGGKEIYNGPNTYGFIPFVAVQNIDSCRDVWGLPDIDNLVTLNCALNELVSNIYYIINRWAQPTIVWEGAPPGYQAIIAGTLAGGGVLPTSGNGRSRIYFLQYTGQPPDTQVFIELLRASGIEVTGLNELAWSGTPSGSINTGPSLQINFTNVQSTLAAKQESWRHGLKRLMWMLLTLGEQQGAIGVVTSPKVMKSRDRNMALTGKDIGKHREVDITWPGLLPADDIQAARFELEKLGAGVQSKATTLERLGFDFPDDELNRIEEEMKREGLYPGDQANLMRAQATMLKAQPPAEEGPPVEETGDVEGDVGVEALPPEEPLIPDDLDQLSDTPPGYGTLPDGRMVDQAGRDLDSTSQALVRLQAQRLMEQQALGAPMDEAEAEVA